MKNQWLKMWYHELILILVIVVLIIIKFPHLSLPYYSDEGFAFGPAVHLMYQSGPSILPSGLEPDYSYGHPLLFHFLVASWMQIFGESIFVAKSFALFVSVLLLITIYLTGKSLFSKDAGLLAALLLFFQPVFLAQSSFVLLEILLSLLGLLTVYFFYKKNWLLYALSASALVMTKESGLFLIFALCTWQLFAFLFIKEEKTSFTRLITNYLIILIPAFVFGIFLLVQKLTWGWFLYPNRLDHMVLDYKTFVENLSLIRKYIFVDHGRSWMAWSFLASLFGYFFISKKKFTGNQWKSIGIIALVIGIFWLMSALNFISNRYFLVTIVMLTMLVGLFTLQAFQAKRWLLYPMAFLLVFSQSIYSFRHYTTGDDNLGFTDAVIVHRDAVRFMENAGLRDEYVFAHFLMLYNLRQPISGYLTDGRVFTNLTGIYTDSVDYAVISNVELSHDLDSIRRLPHLELMKRVETGLAWTEIYRNTLNYKAKTISE